MSRVSWEVKTFAKARLIDTGEEIDFSQYMKVKDIVTVLASRTLTDNEEWNLMEKGEFKIFRNGRSLKY